MPPEPPCHVAAWARAHGVKVRYDNANDVWIDGRLGPVPVPDHDSAEWFKAVFVAAAEKWGIVTVAKYLHQGPEHPWGALLGGYNPAFALTPHEVLCAAVRGQPQ